MTLQTLPRPVGLITLIALALVVPASSFVVTPGASAEPDDITRFDDLVPSFDGHQVPVTVYQAAVTDANGQAPTLLWGHGWSGNRGAADGDGAFFAEHGYNVVAMDFRGHGDASGASVARVHSVDYEVKDVSAVIDWIADQGWAELDGADDPVLGALGGSYGGGYQLLTAAFDERLDAIAPEITWNDLPYALAPNGGIKSAWVDLLYLGAKATGTTVASEIDAAYQDAMLTNEFPDGTTPSGVDIVSWFEASSPKSYPGAIDVPTLLIQGIPDTLFNLNQAVWNYEQIAATGADTYLFTHLGGHIINSDGTLPVPSPVPVGLQPPSGGSPCGDADGIVLAFYDHYLRGAPTFEQAPVTLATEQGACITSPTWPVYASTTLALPPVPVVSALAGPGVLVPLELPAGATTVAGIPQLSGTVTGAAVDATIYLSLVAVGPNGERTLDAQVTALEVEGPAASAPFDIELGGVASAIGAHETLLLRVATWDAQYASNADRTPDGVVLDELVLALPTDAS